MTETRSSVRNLETLVGQLANMLNNRPQGNLPSNTEVNPKEQCQAITLRSVEQGVNVDHKRTEKIPPVVVDQPARVPYPQRLRETTLDKLISKILEVFKKLHINIPFTEALEQMPSYVKFMKEIMLRKEGWKTMKLWRSLKNHALCDLGATINLMPLSVFKRLGLGEARPTTITLQLEDRSMKHPWGITEDVLVKAMMYLRASDSCYSLDVIDKAVSKRRVSSVASEAVLIGGEEDDDDVEMREYALPNHLCYAYLGEKDTLSIIVSAVLSKNELEKLLSVLRVHKLSIGWTLADIRGISPSIVMYKILLGEDSKPSIEAQRRLNQTIREVVLKQILKWLDAGVIYPISDNAWVSPIQVVPKKGRITVGKNGNNELIPTRTVNRWRICIDYRKLNKATRKDHFPLPFNDQMLDMLAGNERMHFRLCNAPAIFQWCMMAIFLDMVEMSIEIFMDDFSIFGSSFDMCLECLHAFKVLKEKLTTAPIVVAPNWDLSFELMCDSSEYAVGVVLGQRINKVFRSIYYATTEMELLVIVFDFDKFRPYLIGNKIKDFFPDEQLFGVNENSAVPWFADFVNFLVSNIVPPELTKQQLKKFYSEVKHYYWEEPILYRHCFDQVICRCVPEDEMHSILAHYHNL
ncbi:uncharacterized protein LOC133779425 [Humulus lupulus]|uniref:uncharacterized protein LOC133779425 n=1 Tax=Humulus lupulus TaxID=3486 RepID=UPI002B41334F|nr:uncharacterized protein LOC133779425 [Humulus lupulus]